MAVKISYMGGTEVNLQWYSASELKEAEENAVATELVTDINASKKEHKPFLWWIHMLSTIFLFLELFLFIFIQI